MAPQNLNFCLTFESNYDRTSGTLEKAIDLKREVTLSYTPYGDKEPKEYGKVQPSCREKCEEFPPNTMERHFCLESCKPNPDSFHVCDGKPSYTFEENPYTRDYQVISGTPCNEGHPMWKYKYKTEIPPNTTGILYKFSKCPCGCITRYTLETITQPNHVIRIGFSNWDSN